MPVTISGTNGVTFPDSSLQAAAASPYVLKNRIINGDMRIDQRNAGASVTPSSNAQYTLDRWNVTLVGATSKFSVQQNAASVTPPTGFRNYLGVTSLSAYTVAAGDIQSINQQIEGYNFADLGWGTASAQTVALSFWVRSSLTGTFGGALRNENDNRSYPFTYTISSANTWEQKTVTIAGDTSGTWTGSTNGIGVRLCFNLGTGTTYSGTASSWSSNLYVSATGATSVVGTNGATFYITGVQLEQNTSATPFERRLYNQELANCQRYFQTSTNAQGIANSTTTLVYFTVGLQTPMRSSPTVGLTGVYSISDIFNADYTQSSATVGSTLGSSSSALLVGLTSFTGLVSGRFYLSRYLNANVITLSAEL
jgi:hypothetical protein